MIRNKIHETVILIMGDKNRQQGLLLSGTQFVHFTWSQASQPASQPESQSGSPVLHPLAAVSTLGAALAADLHDATAHGEGHDEPAEDEEDEGNHEAGVVTEFLDLAVSEVVGPGGVGTEHHHRPPDGEAEVDAPEHGADEAEEPETKLLTTRDLAVLLSHLLGALGHDGQQVEDEEEDAGDEEILRGPVRAELPVLVALPEHDGAEDDLDDGVAALGLLPLLLGHAPLLHVHAAHHLL